MVMKMQRLMMKGMMPCPPMICVAAPIMSYPKFLLQIFLRGGVSVFSAAVYVGSLIRLCEVKVFDEAELLALRTGGRYGWGPLVPMPTKPSGVHPCILLWPRCVVKCSDDFYHVKIP